MRFIGLGALVLVVGCGRIAFDPLAVGAAGDAALPLDAPRFFLDAGECPPGYTFVMGSCYRYMMGDPTSRFPWLEAEQACEADAEGAHLVVVDNVTEANAIDSFVPPSELDHWIGTTDRRTEGTFLSVTGQLPGYSVWGGGSPMGLGFECVQFTDARELFDRPCDEPNGYLCEYDGIRADPAAY